MKHMRLGELASAALAEVQTRGEIETASQLGLTNQRYQWGRTARHSPIFRIESRGR